MSLNEACPDDASLPTLAVVAQSADDLKQKLASALEVLKSDAKEKTDPRGIYFHIKPAERKGKVAFLFPGQGSQYPNMLAQAGTTVPRSSRSLRQSHAETGRKMGPPLGPVRLSGFDLHARRREDHAGHARPDRCGSARIGSGRHGHVPLDGIAGHHAGLPRRP